MQKRQYRRFWIYNEKNNPFYCIWSNTKDGKNGFSYSHAGKCESYFNTLDNTTFIKNPLIKLYKRISLAQAKAYAKKHNINCFK